MNEVEEKNMQIQMLGAEVDSLKKQLADRDELLRQTTEKLTADLKIAEDTLARENALADSKGQFEQAVKEAAAENAKLRGQVVELQAQRVKLQQQLAELEQSKMQVKEFAETAKQASAESAKLRDAVAEKDSSVARLKGELERVSKEKDDSLNYARDLFARQKEEIASLGAEIEDLTRTSEAAEQLSEKVQLQVSSFEKRQAEAADLTKELRVRVKELEGLVSQRDKQIAASEKAILKAESNMATRLASESETKEFVKQLKAELAVRDKRIKAGERALAQANKQQDRLEATHERALAKIAKLHATVLEKLRKRDKELSKLKHQIVELKKRATKKRTVGKSPKKKPNVKKVAKKTKKAAGKKKTAKKKQSTAKKKTPKKKIKKKRLVKKKATKKKATKKKVAAKTKAGRKTSKSRTAKRRK